jgi:hypothetical protein
MPQINSIHLHIQTGNLSGAGTDGDVYLGLCGREFSIDTTRDDFERGAAREYILGEGANINNSDVNDPRSHLLLTENVANFPVYLRFQPRSRTDNWQLQRADVRFNGSLHIDWDTVNFIVNDPTQGIWLGVRSGLVVHLEDHSHGPVPVTPAS